MPSDLRQRKQQRREKRLREDAAAYLVDAASGGKARGRLEMQQAHLTRTVMEPPQRMCNHVKPNCFNRDPFEFGAKRLKGRRYRRLGCCCGSPCVSRVNALAPVRAFLICGHLPGFLVLLLTGIVVRSCLSRCLSFPPLMPIFVNVNSSRPSCQSQLLKCAPQ